MPEIIVMENVTDVVRHKVYHDFVSHLKTLGVSRQREQRFVR